METKRPVPKSLEPNQRNVRPRYVPRTLTQREQRSIRDPRRVWRLFRCWRPPRRGRGRVIAPRATQLKPAAVYISRSSYGPDHGTRSEMPPLPLLVTVYIHYIDRNNSMIYSTCRIGGASLRGKNAKTHKEGIALKMAVAQYAAH